MRITRKFKQLTRYTTPRGQEHRLTSFLPDGYKSDGLGNYFIEIGDRPTTMFTCHLDTVGGKRVKVTHRRVSEFIFSESTILGADDKAGMVVLLYMIEKAIPGLYYFFIGEESGCVGSNLLYRNWKQTEFSNYITKIVSFDRRGEDSVITKQVFERSCSEEFAIELSERLNSTGFGFNFSPDPTGLFTDSAVFMYDVPECTNISVGYYNEHTLNEVQNIEFLIKLCKAVCMINWESLPVVRKPFEMIYEYLKDDDIDDDSLLTWNEENYSYFKDDNEFNESGVIKLYISKEYVDAEAITIFNWLSKNGSYYGLENIYWNGNALYAEGKSFFDYVGDRCDISKFLPELTTIPKRHTRKRIRSH